jgi:hypothetical protein
MELGVGGIIEVVEQLEQANVAVIVDRHLEFFVEVVRARREGALRQQLVRRI